MGYTQAIGFAEAVNDGSVSLDSALSYHLFSNHYPPLPAGTLKIAKRAIAKWNSGKRDAKVDVSAIGSHRRYGTRVPVAVCLDAWHLWPFVNQDDDFYGDM